MTVLMHQPRVDELADVVQALRDCAHDDAPAQLHPGDLGWHQSFGADRAAASARTWSREGRVLAVGMLDSPSVLRLAVAPSARADRELEEQVLADLDRPGLVLPSGSVSVEVRCDSSLPALLRTAGWVDDEPWTPLVRDLADPVEDSGRHVEVVGDDLEQVGVRAAVQRASFDRSTFDEERWHAMSAGAAYRDAQCLVARDHRGDAVALATVWSAGAGRPGLLEPVGTHHDHRRRGHGRAITLAAASALRALGSSLAVVCTPAANTAAVATYRSAGFRQLPDARDLRRP